MSHRSDRLLVLAAVCALGAAGLAQAQVATTPAPQDVVAARQAAFDMSAGVFGGMKAAAASGAEVKTQAFAAKGLAKWAKALPGLFTAGSGTGATGARPEIWTDRAGFEKAAADYAAAADKLAQAAQANDKAAFTAQLAEVGKACGGCHKAYRVEEKKPG